MTLPEIEITW